MRSLPCLSGRRGFMVALLVAALLSVSQPAFAQQQAPQLGADLLSADSLNEQQQSQVVQYVEHHAQVLLQSQNAADLSEARRQLLAPLLEDTTQPPAHNALSDAIAEALSPLAEREHGLPRVNGLIVISELSTGRTNALPLVLASLTHAHPAVRYRAARVMIQFLDGNSRLDLTPGEEERLLESLSTALQQETDPGSLEKLYQLAGIVPAPEARLVALEVLSERASIYAGGLRPSLHADQQGLASVAGGLSRDEANGVDVDESLRRLTAAAAQLLDAVTRQLVGDADDVPGHVRLAAIRMVQQVEQVFNLSLQHFDPNASRGPALGQLAEQEEFESLRANALEWIGTGDADGLLSQSQIGLAQDDLR